MAIWLTTSVRLSSVAASELECNFRPRKCEPPRKRPRPDFAGIHLGSVVIFALLTASSNYNMHLVRPITSSDRPDLRGIVSSLLSLPDDGLVEGDLSLWCLTTVS